jgi:hypothetical protein
MEDVNDLENLEEPHKSVKCHWAIWPSQIGLGVVQLLKVPKRENFGLAFFTLCDPIWVGDLGTEAKNWISYHFDGLWFFTTC